MPTETLAATATAIDTFPINGTDYIEFYVGNAKQAAHYYRPRSASSSSATAGRRPGTRDRASYLLQQNKIRFVLTTPLRPDDADRRARPRARRRRARHRALGGRRARGLRAAIERGAEPAHEPTVLRDERARWSSPRIQTYGDTIH